MNILFLFIKYPENPGDTNLTKDLSDEFARRGESVYVATIRETKHMLDTQVAVENNINVLRVKTGNMFDNVSRFEKLVSMMTLNNEVLKQIKNHWGDVKFDFIVGTSPHMANYKLIRGLKKHYNCPAFLILWDLFPQNAKDLGLIKNKFIFNYFQNIEKKNLKSFDYIGCQSIGNLDYMNNNYKYLDSKKLFLFPQWSKIGKELEFDKNNMREKYGFTPDDFILVFGGNMGKPQNLSNIINLANEVKLEKKVKFLFVGQGTETKKLKTLVKNLNLTNVTFEDFIPREDYEKLIASCDVGLVSLDPRFTFPNFPSKILDYLKLGLPILASLDEYALADYGNLIENEIQAGLCCEATNMNLYKSNLLKLLNDHKLCGKLSFNGRQYFEHNFNVNDRYNDFMNIVR